MCVPGALLLAQCANINYIFEDLYGSFSGIMHGNHVRPNTLVCERFKPHGTTDVPVMRAVCML